MHYKGSGAQNSSSVPWEGVMGQRAWVHDSIHELSEVLGEVALDAYEQILSVPLLQHNMETPLFQSADTNKQGKTTIFSGHA